MMCLNCNAGEPREPGCGLGVFVRTFESIVVGYSPDEDRYRQSGERQLAQTLRQCFLRNRMADTSVAILERMNGHKCAIPALGAVRLNQAKNCVISSRPLEEGGA